MSGGVRGERASVIRPRALRRGSRLAIVSPASVVNPELVARGARRLEAMGFATTMMPHALCSGPLRYAGTAEERVADLHAAFADPAIDGIVCSRGGWGSAELLPLLDTELVRCCAKPFIGYSDQTSLQMWLQAATGMVTFYGPMVAADFAMDGGVDVASWESSLCRATPWELGAGIGLRALRPGVAEGTLLGGCLALVTEALGTPYAMALPSEGRCILFLEDVNVRPYQWDRMLLHLRYAGVLERAAGIVFGDMGQSAPAEEQALLEQTILHALRDFDGPVAIGLRCGHVSGGNITLPLGVEARLDLGGEEPRLQLLTAAVEV